MAMLAIGAAWGRLVGHLVAAVLRGLGITLAVSLPSYAVVGAAAALGDWPTFCARRNSLHNPTRSWRAKGGLRVTATDQSRSPG